MVITNNVAMLQNKVKHYNENMQKSYLTRFVPRARRPNVYSSAVVGFGGSSRSRNRNTIVDLPCIQCITVL